MLSSVNGTIAVVVAATAARVGTPVCGFIVCTDRLHWIALLASAKVFSLKLFM